MFVSKTTLNIFMCKTKKIYLDRKDRVKREEIEKRKTQQNNSSSCGTIKTGFCLRSAEYQQ